MKHITPSGPISASVRLPGSKSITNRALVVAALADGISRLRGALDADDTRAMVESLQGMGVDVRWEQTDLVVVGAGGSPGHGDVTIDARGSGTTARFLAAAAALRAGTTTIDGNRRLRERPMGDLVRALGGLGAAVEALGEDDRLPLRIHGPALEGGATVVDAGRSSQFVSALLMAAACAESDVILELTGPVVSRPYIDQTLQVMAAFGSGAGWDGPSTLIVPAGGYEARTYDIEGDASAAAYPLSAAAICGGTVTVGPIPAESVQADLALLAVLGRMGAEISHRAGRITLTGRPRTLQPVAEDMNAAPDAVLALAVTALFADGESHITDIANLRLKESDRIEDLAAELRKLGATVVTTPDSLTVEPGDLRPASIDPHDDHRMAMAFAVAGLRIPGVAIEDPEVVAKTWPEFFDVLETLRSPLVVAIDGPAGVGKSSVSEAVAGRFGLRHLETGGTYRAAALAVVEAGIEPDDEEAVARLVDDLEVDIAAGRVLLNGRDVTDDVRTEAVSTAASRVSALPRVRRALVELQRRWVAAETSGAVVEGRDIGTVVFPDSPVKVFLTADPEVRAARRVGDLGLSPEEIPRIAADMAARDERDSTRAVSPLRPAQDAVELDTSNMSIDEVVGAISRLVLHRR
ncbi:MAG: 3-phosphoshikimate 1-carboxyvinyltransferase [Acidimicrobiia bacterium]|nr:3-phosphoshikimate 1-carboxyvinyltransferase [Acidimicrobiia bacterium]MBT8217361.1 3-phosphoshikimate 1-carboxyvinyltransferase [Acidimicrobiia bacterium]NNF10183.1 3-phosphoshikimate 1-carboxyvinyltransferase [Acidimicrobiia bacterium]NNL69079.1 3-phosphoshikimate 1-carboxyvinyltransferase [Acidimicrobiia bacterium]